MYQMMQEERYTELSMQNNNKQHKGLLSAAWKQAAPLAFLGLILAACNGTQQAGNETAKVNQDTVAQQEAPTLSANMLAGKQVYENNCLTCHQSSGSGVPNLNPPLKGTEYVLGDKNRLIGIVLKGSNAGLEINGETFDNSMPPHDFLKDDEIAHVLSYVRNSFGNQADTVTVDEVKAVRAAL